MSHPLYPLREFTGPELAKLAEFDAAPAAPESYVRQHRSEETCWCSPIQVGTLGVWTHQDGDES